MEIRELREDKGMCEGHVQKLNLLPNYTVRSVSRVRSAASGTWTLSAIKKNRETRFFLALPTSSVSTFSTSDPYSFIRLSLTPYNLSNLKKLVISSEIP